jgi:type I restriction enzyme S subunit
MVPLGEVLMPVSREELVVADRRYHILGAHWYAEGLYTKEIKDGAGIAAAKVYRVEEGDFVYNRLFAWKGSFALASEENHGCYVSNEFPCFSVVKERLVPKFLQYYFSRESAWTEALGLSSGGTPTSRNRLKEGKLLEMQIPLPPLPEQRRIVAKVEELAANIEEAKRLQLAVRDECDVVCRSILLSDPQGLSAPTSMHELVSLRQEDVAVVPSDTYHFAGVYCFGKGVFAGDRKTGLDFAYKSLTRLRAGDFVYPKLMAWEGALGTVPSECDGLCVSPEYPVFALNLERVLPETLDVYFRTPSVWPQLAEISTGTNVRRRRLHPKNFLAYQMPLPPMEIQQRLRQVKGELDSVKSQQARSAAELDALLPSVLDRAFKGEL